jgi:hypothetical protein
VIDNGWLLSLTTLGLHILSVAIGSLELSWLGQLTLLIVDWLLLIFRGELRCRLGSTILVFASSLSGWLVE